MPRIARIKPIPLQNRWRSIRPLCDVKPGEQTCALEVTGVSLAEHNIVPGDFLVFVFGREPKPGDLCVVSTPAGITACFVYPAPQQRLLLKSSHAADIWHTSEVKVLGVVKRLERDY